MGHAGTVLLFIRVWPDGHGHAQQSVTWPTAKRARSTFRDRAALAGGCIFDLEIGMSARCRECVL